MYIYANPNPVKKQTGDCVIRAISILLDEDWLTIYDELTDLGREMYANSVANDVWSEYLYRQGYTRKAIPDTCPICYTVKQFCIDHPQGEYLLATGEHVVTVINGDYYDTWDSGDEIPIYYFYRRKI